MMAELNPVPLGPMGDAEARGESASIGRGADDREKRQCVDLSFPSMFGKATVTTSRER